jgi:hypothetical protein
LARFAMPSGDFAGHKGVRNQCAKAF